MRKIFAFTLISFATIVATQTVSAQGCVAIRGGGGSSCTVHESGAMHTGWMFSANYRYYKSFRHFRENHEEKDRVANGSDVRNYTNFLDLSIIRNINPRWSIGINLPLSATTRSSLYEHDGKTRHSTSSVGIGDLRLTAYRWMVDPTKMTRGNVQIGLGLKLPTGDYKYQDFFYRNDSTSVLGPVDQSIQLGDGGTGLSAEINAYYNFSNTISVYGNFYYLLNPREQNGTSTSRGAAPTAANIANGSFVMSVPDQFMIRAGMNLKFNKAAASIGIRQEVLPAKDLVGGSNGFRRPGYIISAEPGFSYELKKMNVYVYVPVALVRERTQSVPDQIRSKLTGVRTVGDAAFADYSINIGTSFRF
jgi:hypothetical protein